MKAAETATRINPVKNAPALGFAMGSIASLVSKPAYIAQSCRASSRYYELFR
jgi:hypothetical protein